MSKKGKKLCFGVIFSCCFVGLATLAKFNVQEKQVQQVCLKIIWIKTSDTKIINARLMLQTSKTCFKIIKNLTQESLHGIFKLLFYLG